MGGLRRASRSASLVVGALSLGVVRASSLAAQAKPAAQPAEKQFSNPAGLLAPRGYTHTVSVRGGRTIYIAGQVPVDSAGQVIGNDLRAQTTKTFENLRTALAAAGASFADLVKTTTFVVNLNPETDLPIIREVRSKFLTGDHPPASTLVGVQQLFRGDVRIEIEAIAVVN